MRKTIIALILAFITCVPIEYLKAQDSTDVILVADTIKRRSVWNRLYHYFADANKKNTKKFDVSFIGGPHYSSDTKLGIGIVAAGLYSLNRKDTLTPISNVSFFGDVTTTGFYLLGIRGNNIFRNYNWRIDYNLYFYSFPGAFWGLGYTAGDNDANVSSYLRSQMSVKFDFLFKIAPKLYIGPAIGFDFTEGSKMLNPELIAGYKTIYRSYNYGAVITYDSRDFIPNAYKGFYFKLQQRNFTDFSSKPFFKTNIAANYYQQAWKGAVFAFDAYSEFSYGKTPWTMMAPIGGSYRMRGYYEGRYRDDNMFTFQVEYRQKIYNRHGVVAWGGFGNIWGKEAFSWKHTLPNYGVGYRWEFKKRVNVRLDYGFGKGGQDSFMFSINEAF
ncbi:MAG: hypothetical protein RR312_00155 [Bacteroidales bacterium]